MYKHTLRVNGEYLAKAQAMPSGSSAAGNSGSIKAGSTMGAMEIVMAAATDVTLPASTQVTLTLEGSDDNSTFAPLPVNFSTTTDSKLTKHKEGEAFARLPLPSDAPKYVRCRIGTNKSGVTGTVDVFCDFLPR